MKSKNRKFTQEQTPVHTTRKVKPHNQSRNSNSNKEDQLPLLNGHKIKNFKEVLLRNYFWGTKKKTYSQFGKSVSRKNWKENRNYSKENLATNIKIIKLYLYPCWKRSSRGQDGGLTLPSHHERHAGSGRGRTLSVVGAWLLPSVLDRRWFRGLGFRE